MSTVFVGKIKLFLNDFQVLLHSRFKCAIIFTMSLFEAENYRGKRVCVALSGGVDSVCLLHAFHEQAQKYSITLTAAHLEHGIRGESSQRDCAFCEDLCRTHEIPLTVRHADILRFCKENGVGIEEQARKVRYEWLHSLVSSDQTDLIATAHHLDDVAETVLFRLIRGTSPAGMRAIGQYDWLVRPLLNVSKAQIEDYAAQNGLAFVVDESNADEAYARNYIRHTLLPAMERVSPHAGEHLVRFAFLTAADDAFLNSLADERIKWREQEGYVPMDLADPLFSRAALCCMRKFGIDDYTGANFREVEKLKRAQSGKSVCLPNGKRAFREGNFIVFTDMVPSVCASETSFLPHGAQYDAPVPFSVWEEGELFPIRQAGKTLCVDLDSFPEGCVVRTKRSGDVFHPYHGAKTTLKKFLTNRKISARVSERLPLIACGDEVLVVVDVEISENVKITDKTVRRGYLGSAD